MQHGRRDERAITVGPLPIRVTYLLAPALLGLLSALIGGGSLVAALIPPEARTLRCTRTADTIACEERSGARLVRRLEGPTSALAFTRVGGHHAKRCLVLGEQLVCSPSAEQNVERLRALASGGSVELDVTVPRAWWPIAVGVLFAGMLLVVAALQVFSYARAPHPHDRRGALGRAPAGSSGGGADRAHALGGRARGAPREAWPR